MLRSTVELRPRNWAATVGAILLVALGTASVLRGVVLVLMLLPLTDGGGSSDGSSRMFNSVIGTTGVFAAGCFAACGLLPVASPGCQWGLGSGPAW
jgi:quinol-cytochrome oxidoreductase complex cytochrome b subunit